MAVIGDEAEEAPNITVTETTTPSITTTTTTTEATATEKHETKSQNATKTTQAKPETALSDHFPTTLGTQRDGDSGLGRSTGGEEDTRSSCAVAASDFFTGPPSEHTLVSSTAAGATAKRMTSLEGSNSLDSLSKLTVQNQFGQLSLTPQHHGGYLTDPFHRNDPAPEPLSDHLGDNLVVGGGSLLPVSFDQKQEYAYETSSLLTEEKPITEKYNLISEVSLPPVSFTDDEPAREGVLTSKNTKLDNNVRKMKPKIPADSQSEKGDGIADEEGSTPTPAHGSQRPTEYRQLSVVEIHMFQKLAGTRGDPQYPEYVLKSARLATFPTPTLLSGVPVDTEQLADSGFFFPNVEGGRCVTCFQCGSSLYLWQEGMSAAVEHVFLSPWCPFSRR